MKRTAAEIISCILIVLFGYTAFSKLSTIHQFRDVLKTIPLTRPGADVIARMLPLTELFIVLLLFFEKTRLSGLYASLILLAGFTLFLGYMVLFVPDLPCSCGGVISKMSWKQHVVFNVFFVGLSLWGVMRIRQLPEV